MQLRKFLGTLEKTHVYGVAVAVLFPPFCANLCAKSIKFLALVPKIVPFACFAFHACCVKWSVKSNMDSTRSLAYMIYHVTQMILIMRIGLIILVNKWTCEDKR